MSRQGRIERQTKETAVTVCLTVDGTGQASLSTGVPFLDHMLDQICRHGLIDLEVRAEGDLQVDPHHTTEDVGICFGQALDQALGNRAGLVRFGHAYAPLDEALGFCCLDFSGRGSLCFEAPFDEGLVGEFPLELVEDFFKALASNARATLHLKSVTGRNMHHRVESMFKAFALALRQAASIDPRRQGVPSTKGTL